MSTYARSRELFERSQRLIPGGVNSPVRAFRAVGGTPVFFREGRGARLVDEDGREYVDYVGSWGPLILGHADPEVLARIQAAAARGLSFGAPTALELEMAELLTAQAIVHDYNDPRHVDDAFKRCVGEIAAVVLEPFAGNMNFVRPTDEFINGRRKLSTQHGAVLVFDEEMTGFRVGPRGAQ